MASDATIVEGKFAINTKHANVIQAIVTIAAFINSCYKILILFV